MGDEWYGGERQSLALDLLIFICLLESEKVTNRQIDVSVEFREMVQVGDINLGISADR